MFTVMQEDNRVDPSAMAFKCLKAFATAYIPDLDSSIA